MRDDAKSNNYIKFRLNKKKENILGKQCKPVQAHSFSQIVFQAILRKFACWGDAQSPRISSDDDGYAARLLTISEENICIKMLCDDGDGCDDETESEQGPICIVTIVTLGEI